MSNAPAATTPAVNQAQKVASLLSWEIRSFHTTDAIESATRRGRFLPWSIFNENVAIKLRLKRVGLTKTLSLDLRDPTTGRKARGSRSLPVFACQFV